MRGITITMTNNNFSKMAKNAGEIIIYTRPWFSAYYSLLAFAVKKNLGCNVSFVSDYSVSGSFDLRSTAVSNYEKRSKRCSDDKIKPYISDIIKRDRLLRSLNWDEAELRIHSYYYAIQDYFVGRKVVCVISATVDQYVVDLIYLYCVINKIPFIGYHISVLPKYTLFTARGETHPYRRVTSDEIDHAIGVISDTAFRPAYIPKPNALKIVGLKRYGKNLIRYIYYRILSIFPAYKLNYHVEASVSESKKRLSINIIRALTWRYEKVPLGRYLYLPLQFHPECNSEYWGRNDTYEDYEDKIVKFAQINSAHWNIVIKEHPNMLGVRLASFYLALKKSGCQIVHPSQEHRSLIRESYAVVTLNSSAGIEGLCEGKVIICLSNPYYRSDYHLIKKPEEIVKSDEIESILNKRDAVVSLRDTVRSTVESSAPIHLPDINYRTGSDPEGYGLESAKIFSQQIPALMSAIIDANVSAAECYTITEG